MGMVEHFKKKGLIMTGVSVVYKTIRDKTRPEQEWFYENPNMQRIRDYKDGTSLWEDRNVIEFLDVNLTSIEKRRIEENINKGLADDDD